MISRRVLISAQLLTAALLWGSISAFAQPAIVGVGSAAPIATRTGNIARGELISIYGTGLSTTTASSLNAPVSSLGGASVTLSTQQRRFLCRSSTPHRCKSTR